MMLHFPELKCKRNKTLIVTFERAPDFRKVALCHFIIAFLVPVLQKFEDI